MNVLTDPEMKEIVDDFCEESTMFLSELRDLVVFLEENPVDSERMEQFGQIIDRIMGAAKSIGADEIGLFCDLGKNISYKASQVSEKPLLDVVVAVLADTVEMLTLMITELKTGNKASLKNINTKVFGTRLKWLSEKFKHISRASCATIEGGKELDLSQDSIDDLLTSLGL